MKGSIYTLSLALVVAIAAPAVAQTRQDRPPSITGSQPDRANLDNGRPKRDTQGRIVQVDEPGMLTLDNGLVLIVPTTATVERGELSPGARVQARYEDRHGLNVITELKVSR
ncbi:MAG TPA: hypothetical protein VGT40_19035 [Methylomirabilota bacterium]|nr:hypothetical protein [Methylomirabilota bacterium]